MTNPAISIENLTKYYTDQQTGEKYLALDHVNLDIPKGSIFGLLGRNGAGKSTLINTLGGLVQKTEGKVVVWGHNIDHSIKEAKHSIGIVSQELIFDPFFTPGEILDYQAGYFGILPKDNKTDELLKAVELYDKRDAHARTLSGGMKRRLMVAKAMVHSPPILVLDEPTAGVDIELRKNLWVYIRELNKKGTTIIFTTHYLEEAEALCDRIAILDKGKVMVCEPTKKLLHMIDKKIIHLSLSKPLNAAPQDFEGACLSLKDETTLTIKYAPSKTNAYEVLEKVKTLGIIPNDITTEQSDLEDVFLEITKKKTSA
ncbi:MAG: ABC transporter ATP-binding protein [Alphaproteobacteria bacterium]|jgi:ABC-2 type transport system ATP-binding protein|nr:ABC transporter ATP-binding protein [Alphaproteobacteria bacterium]MBP9877456.1 ABC transporter ATP-binding protein [Alphaproteobacteria bacterium]